MKKWSDGVVRPLRKKEHANSFREEQLATFLSAKIKGTKSKKKKKDVYRPAS